MALEMLLSYNRLSSPYYLLHDCAPSVGGIEDVISIVKSVYLNIHHSRAQMHCYCLPWSDYKLVNDIATHNSCKIKHLGAVRRDTLFYMNGEWLAVINRYIIVCHLFIIRFTIVFQGTSMDPRSSEVYCWCHCFYHIQPFTLSAIKLLLQTFIFTRTVR